jgi:hypothetical protein
MQIPFMEKTGFTLFGILAVCGSLMLLAVFVQATAPERPHVDLTFTYSATEVKIMQGESVKVNCTVFNTDYNYSINAGLATLFPTFNNSYTYGSESERAKVYNATYNPWVLEGLQPRESRTATLTIDFASDVPVGSYVFPLQGYADAKLNVTVKPRV